MKREPEILARLAGEIAQSLAAYAIVDADVVLDEARRLVFLVQFSGAGIDECIERLAVPAEAVVVARKFEGFTIEEVGIVVPTARYALWVANFATLPDSAFARMAKQWELDHSNDGVSRLN